MSGQAAHLDRDTVTRLLMRHHDMLRAYIRVVLRNPALIDDVMQETAVVIMGRGSEVTGPERFPAWARGVARRVALSMARKELRRPTIDPDVLDIIDQDWDDLTDTLVLEEKKAALKECVEGLSPSSRRLITMRYEQALSGKEMVLRLGRTLNGIYVALNKTYQTLQECMKLRLVGTGESS